MRDKISDIRADMAGALLNEGDFNTSQRGLTVFIRQMSNKGEINGILVHNNRDRAHPVTYIAEKGILAQTPAGTRLIMVNGTIETSAQSGCQVLHFELHHQPGPVLRPYPLHLAQDPGTLSGRIVLAV